jgi:hypothetical protein
VCLYNPAKHQVTEVKVRSADHKARTASYEVAGENSNTGPPKANTGRTGQLKYKDRKLRFICKERPLGYDLCVIWITFSKLSTM